MRREYTKPRIDKAAVTLQAVSAQVKTTGGREIIDP